MTISSTTRKAGPFDGNDVTTSFPFTFKVFSAGDIAVVRTMPSGIEETLVLDSDYSVTLNGDQDANPGGTITYPISGDPLPDGWRLTAVGDLDNLQPTDITNGGGFYPQVLENAFDRVTMLIQQLGEELGRTIRIAVSDDVTDGLELPAQGGRAARVLGFDADGNFTTYDRATATSQTTYRQFTATAGQTSFTLPNSYTPGANALYVWMNGAKLISGVDFSETTSTSFTLTNGAQAGDTIEAIAGVPVANGTVIGSDMVTYIPGGTGAQATTVQAKLRESVSVNDFGAVGDGVTDDTSAVQAAVTAAGVGGKVLFPHTANGYLVSSLQMLDGQTWIGAGRETPSILGTGTAVLVKTNPYPSGSYPVRNVHLRDLRIINSNYDAVQLHGAPDSSIQSCQIECTGASAISQILSVRCSINKNRITSSGAATTWKILDNCNGLDGSNNTVSPGSSASGKGIELGLTQTVNLDNLVMEVGGNVGISIGGNVTYGGSCSGISLRGLYFEQVKRPLEIGLQFSVFGVDLTGMYVGNSVTSSVAARDSAIHVGRVKGLIADNFYPVGTGAEALFELYDVTGGAGPNPFLEASRIISNQVVGYSANFVKNAAFTVARENRIFGKNIIQINTNTPIGIEREWISPTIAANVAYPITQVVEPTTFGGFITAVDIIDKAGTITCTLNVGYSADILEVVDVDPDTLTYSAGYVRHINESSNKYVRPGQGLQMRTIAGVGTGTFRVRIRYRV